MKNYGAQNRAALSARRRDWRNRNLAAQQEKQRAYMRANPHITRNGNLKKRCFTLALFNEMMLRQEYRCAVCACDLTILTARQVHADHCHRTKTPRGVLCHGCNIGLGAFGDDPVRLTQAADYLLTHRR